MKTQKYKSLGFEVSFQVPETVEEFDANAKRVGACLSEAINNVVYRSSMAEYREGFLHGYDVLDDAGKVVKHIKGVDEVTGIERKTKSSGKQRTVKGADGVETKEDITVWDEKESEYLDRVIAEKGWDEATAAKNLQPIADAVAGAIAFDASARERKPAQPKKLPQMYVDSATRVIDNGNQEKIVKKLLKESNTVVTLTGDREKDIQALGWGIKANEDAKRAAAAAQYA